MMLRCLSARPGNPAPLPVLSYAKLTPPCPTWGCEGTQHIQAQSPQGEPGMGGVSWEMITPQGSTLGLVTRSWAGEEGWQKRSRL